MKKREEVPTVADHLIFLSGAAEVALGGPEAGDNVLYNTIWFSTNTVYEE